MLTLPRVFEAAERVKASRRYEGTIRRMMGQAEFSYCSECGARIDAAAKFCSECGTRRQPTAPAEEPAPAADSTSQGEPLDASPSNSDETGASRRKRGFFIGGVLLTCAAIAGVTIASSGSGDAGAVSKVQSQCATTWNSAESESVQKGLPLTVDLGVSIQSSGMSNANYNDSDAQQSAVDDVVSSAQVAVGIEDQRSNNCLITILYAQNNKAAQMENAGSAKEFYQYVFPIGWSSTSDPYGQHLQKLGPLPESELYDNVRSSLDSGDFSLRADPKPYIARSSALLIDGRGVSDAPNAALAGMIDCGSGEGSWNVHLKGLSCDEFFDHATVSGSHLRIGSRQLDCVDRSVLEDDPKRVSKPVTATESTCSSSDESVKVVRRHF